MPNWNLNHHESGVARALRYSLKICCYFSRQTLSLHLKMFSIHLEAGLCIVILIAQILWKRCLVSFPKVDEAFCWNTDAGILIQVTSNVSPVESSQLIRTNPSMAAKWTVKKKTRHGSCTISETTGIHKLDRFIFQTTKHVVWISLAPEISETKIMCPGPMLGPQDSCEQNGIGCTLKGTRNKETYPTFHGSKRRWKKSSTLELVPAGICFLVPKRVSMKL